MTSEAAAKQAIEARVEQYLERPLAHVGHVGPTVGFSRQIGTLVSMLAFTRYQVVYCVQGMSTEDLDFLIDAKANSIGATLLHLAATEFYYSLNTFDGLEWGAWPDSVKQEWDVAMNLGDEARRTIKGHSADYYLSKMHAVRLQTLDELRRRDDQWLSATDKEWQWTNHCKWFHVAEHESNHNGQFKFLRGRLPGAQKQKQQ
jgi:hypothetical protein